MVKGFDSFRKHFEGYEDCYTIIGGTACDIIMTDLNMDFRATRDIDMIVLIESRFEEFARIFWDYIKEGEYKCGWKNSDIPHFYRFTEPKDGYPKMIELFSKRPDFQEEHEEIHLTPLPVSDEISSLSAIMLDDNYYSLMMQGRKTMNGVSVLGEEYLIIFKAKAWLDLTKKKENGEHVNDKDIKKHKNDVFRLYTILDTNLRVQLTEPVVEEMKSFLEAMTEEGIRLNDLGIEDITVEEILENFREIYSLDL